MSNVSRKAASVWIPLRNAIEDKCMYWVCRRESTLRILLAGWRINRVNRDSNFRRFRESTLDIVEEKEIERRIR